MITNGQLRQAIMSSCLIWDESCHPEECRIYDLCMKSLDYKEIPDENISNEIQHLLDKTSLVVTQYNLENCKEKSLLNNRLILIKK